MNTTIQPSQVFGYDVLDTTGHKIGTVDDAWADDATGQLEFIGVKTGWFFGKTHIIPAEQAQIADGQIRLPYAEDQIKDAPNFAGDAELSADDEDQIYAYYGMNRSTAPSPTGLGTGGQSSTADIGTETSTGESAGMKLSEEELQVGKREVAAGQARVRKVVRTEHQEVPVELRREEINVERVPATGTEVPSDAFQEKEVGVTATREEPVVGKEAHVTGEVRVGKTAETETRTVGGDVRKEEADVEKDADVVDRT